MATIHNRVEQERGCGYRKKGGTYLISDGAARDCRRLPIPLTVCPCCGAGIKRTRGFTWVMSSLFIDHPCRNDLVECNGCALAITSGDVKFGLMWVGEKFYSTPADFMREGAAMGVSKRIAQIPRDFVVGKTWVLLAHRKAVHKLVDGEHGEVNIEWTPGIFQAFCPSRIEYVVTGEESEDELNRMEQRGITLVNVIRDVDAQTKLL